MSWRDDNPSRREVDLERVEEQALEADRVSAWWQGIDVVVASRVGWRGAARCFACVHADCDDARADQRACARAIDHVSLEATSAVDLGVRGPGKTECQCQEGTEAEGRRGLCGWHVGTNGGGRDGVMAVGSGRSLTHAKIRTSPIVCKSVDSAPWVCAEPWS